jgi:hypothetical protein
MVNILSQHNDGILLGGGRHGSSPMAWGGGHPCGARPGKTTSAATARSTASGGRLRVGSLLNKNLN